jgi:cyclophilin family peptidyl-prolyl cis-trans isomerase
VTIRRPVCASLLVVLAAVLADAADGDLVLDAALEQKSVKLGDDAVLVVTLTNRAASAATVPKLRLARDSISVRVAWPGGGGVVTRLYGSFLENDAGGLAFRQSATPARRVESGDSVTARIAVPAVLAGEMSLTAILADGATTRVESRPVTLEVPGRGRVAAQVETTKGAFRIDFDASSAYGSVASFWTLAKEGAFDGLLFHRVVPGALAQTGDPRGDGTGDRGWHVPGEAPVATATRGDVGLARGAHVDSAGSQWFVVTDAKGALSGGYARLGTVTDGLDVLDALTSNELDPKTGKPKAPDKVVAVKTLLK